MDIALKLHVVGKCPLLMHSNQGANPMHPLTKQMKTLTAQRKKSDEINSQITKLEYQLASYYEEDIGMYIPALCFEATLREAGKKFKKGKSVVTSVQIRSFNDNYPTYIPLKHDGPKDLNALMEEPDFSDFSIVRVGNASVLRCRPRFERWSFDCLMEYDDTDFTPEEIDAIINYAGNKVGLLDRRPKYGLFETKVTPV